jgi:hypothetical protein
VDPIDDTGRTARAVFCGDPGGDVCRAVPKTVLRQRHPNGGGEAVDGEPSVGDGGGTHADGVQAAGPERLVAEAGGHGDGRDACAQARRCGARAAVVNDGGRTRNGQLNAARRQ